MDRHPGICKADRLIASNDHLRLEWTPAIIILLGCRLPALALARVLFAKRCVIFSAEQHPVVDPPLFLVAQDIVGFIDHACIPMLSTQIRVLFELLHQSAIARTYDLNGCIGLHKKDAVVIALVFHGSPK